MGTIQRAAVVMAGGTGERFWPLSRKDRPKQLLNLTSRDRSMLDEAIARVTPLIPAEHVYVITGEHLAGPIRDAGVAIPGENILAEPAKRNTSGALAYAAAALLARYGGDGSNISLAVTTADHDIGEPEVFRRTVNAAMTAAERDAVLVTLGVVPTRPETGYGYIQIERDGTGKLVQQIMLSAVRAFHEKPSKERAEDFIAEGNYFWNSGMFFWRISTFLSELDAARPELSKAVRDMVEAMRADDAAKVRTLFESLDDISIDYALMEHAKRVAMARAEFPWDDVGAWTALDRSYSKDERGNVTVGDPIVVDSENCIVYNDAGPATMAVGVVGAEDLVVVVTNDAVLVIPKDRAQDVRHAVQELKKRNATQL
ncbi:MAG: NTP transferase domain-containing protein [Candidatus Hydrogenedentes bacterium]|nr:NTP transferase domain-containing protein [Candidatus Hydrogenedentota bacterium]